jgi:hypothetical protein
VAESPVCLAVVGKGKSGAVRVYYADLTAYGRIYLATVFTKAEMADIPAKDKRRMATILAAIRRRLED